MPIKNIEQPEIIVINDSLRLRKYDGDYAKLLPGYQDPYVYQNSEGIFNDADKPDIDYVKGMCEYLAKAGEMFFIEVLENGEFVSIGDVTVKNENPPITIWIEKYRGSGIGKAVMKTVIERLRELGFEKIEGSTVYKWNTVSQKMHESLGFKRCGENEDEVIYDLIL